MARAVEFEIRVKGDGGAALGRLRAEATGADVAIGRIADSARRAVESLGKLRVPALNWSAAVQGLEGLERATSQISVGLRSITGESEEFDRAMREANTMAGRDSSGFSRLKGEVAELAKEIPIARDMLANGLYQTISNGVPEDNWIEYLKGSARSAVGGLADIGDVVGVTSTLIKNYGLEWRASGEIQDKIQLTAKNGVTSFGLLAQALPRVTGNAATLGVSIDELMGTFATLTGVSGNTAEVSTQLGAIFTALVKPSSEAAEMAAKMGIQFDAASIKAAGGFQNFLNQLDGSVKAYAQANGVLEQEVYSKLFGSAEAIRALIPLQGELADKFTANVANMVNSAGTMDAAYANMSSHGEAVNQMLRNQWAAVMDVISGYTSAAQPYINFTARLLSTGSSAAILITTFKQLNVQQALVAIRAKGASVAMMTLGLRGKSATAVVRVFSSAMKGGAYSTTALKIALRGLLIATGIGAAITAITTAVEYFVSATGDATESVEKLDDATDVYVQTAASAKVQIDRDIKALGNLIEAKKDTKEAIRRLNETYGELFGTHKTAEEWYKILTEKSQLYIKQIGYEAQAKSLAAQVAEASINKELAAERKSELERTGRHKQKIFNTVTTQSGYTHTTTIEVETEEYKQAKKDMADAEAAEAESQKRLDVITEKTAGLIEEMKQGLTGVNSEVKVSEMTWQQLTDAIDNTEKSLKNTTDTAEIKRLRTYNDQLKARKKILEGMTGLDTQRTGGTRDQERAKTRLEEIRVERELLKTEWLNASAEERMSIESQITALNEEDAVITSAMRRLDDLGKIAQSNDPVFNDNATSLREISDNIQILQSELNEASIEEAAMLNRQIEAWEEKADAIRNAGKSVENNPPVFRADASNLAGITENIKVLSKQLNTASIEEAALLNRQIKAWEEKADAIRNAGKEAESAFDTFRSGYGSLKGIGSGLESITDVVEGNGNAWEALTGIVDGFLQIYDGIKAVAGVVNMLETATGTLTAAKLAEAGATGTATAATVAGATASTAAAAQEAAAAAEVTTAKVAEAAAKTMSAHAGIPWVGIAIAGGMVAAMTGVMLGLPKFAEGGIAYGPTLGIFGEYSGARSNPEVVAPLDRLRSLIGPEDGMPTGGKVEFVIKGRNLVGVYNGERKRRSRR